MKNTIDASTSAGRPDDAHIAGTVYLVGAGPGDPGLLTRRAASLLRRADVVIHDALVSAPILDLIGEKARKIDVGKRCGGRCTPQGRINELLIDFARRERVVVRLKGGDPLIFGRGGEEALALAERGIPFEIVPGITAAAGVSAYAGIPLTFRDAASAVTFVTGHEDVGRGHGHVDWDALARVHGTLAIYMGVGRLATIAAHLIRGGRAATTPAAVIEWGTYARQRSVTGTLGEIAVVTEAAGIRAPALVVIGEVVSLRERLGWFDRLPLRGTRVLIARSRAQPSRLARAFAVRGAEVSEYPRMVAAPVRDGADLARAFHDLADYRWVLFTSPAAVRYFWREAKARGLDSRCLGGIRIAALGRATTQALARRGISPDVSARTFDPVAVGAAIGSVDPVAGSRVLFPREEPLGSPISDHLVRLGFAVDEVAVFQLSREIRAGGGGSLADTDFIVLPSSTAARLVAEGLEGQLPSGRVVAIGPRTAQTALGLGLPVHAIAADHSVEGVVRAVLDHGSNAELERGPRPCQQTPSALAAS